METTANYLETITDEIHSRMQIERDRISEALETALETGDADELARIARRVKHGLYGMKPVEVDPTCGCPVTGCDLAEEHY